MKKASESKNDRVKKGRDECVPCKKVRDYLLGLASVIPAPLRSQKE